MAENGATLDASLRKTKLFVPQVSHWQDLLPRPRLMERLQLGLTRKLTLISAPAGYGKTMLLAEWIPQSGRAVAWLSLDETDNDLIRFLTYFVTALQTLEPNFGQTFLETLQASPLPPLESLSGALINEITNQLGQFALALDDYHLIQLPMIHTAMAFLLNHLPPNMHLILASRADPPLPLARLRVRGQLNEVRAADLRFSLDEATVFFQQIKDLPIPTEQIKEIDTRTEGWGAGLHLAALSLQGLEPADMARFINDFTGSHHNVFDYLAEDVLHQQPAAMQRFLLRTAVLSRLCGPLCDAVMKNGELGPGDTASLVASSPSQTILEQIEHANLFLVPLDGRRRWYRYHHLFADFLRDRLTHVIAPEAVRELYRRASAWFEENDFLSEAIDAALLAHAFEQAARLVDTYSTSARMQGDLSTLLRWLTTLPDAAFEARPTLALNHAFTLAVLDQFALAERRLDAAKRALHAAPVLDRDLLGQAAVVRAEIVQLTEQAGEVTLAACEEALALLPPSSANWRNLVSLVLGVAYYAQKGAIKKGLQLLVDVEQVSLKAGDLFSAINTAAHIAIALEMGGRLRASERRNRESLQHIHEPFWQGVPLAAYAGFGLSRVLYEYNDLPTARVLLINARQQLEAWSLKRPLLIVLVMLARVHQALGESAQAQAAMGQAVAMVQKDDLKQTFSHWAEYRVRMALARGDLSTSAQWVRAVEATLSGELDPAREFSQITLALVYLAQGRLGEAQALLAQLLPAARAAERFGRVIEIQLLQALVADAYGQRTEALAALEGGLHLAEPEGYIRTFVDLGPQMATLLQAAQPYSSHSAYIATLLASFPSAEASQAQAAVAWQPRSSPLPQPLLEPLSARELEILQLLARGFSNPEIGQQVYISPQTVKVHTRNIYGKLSVNSRGQAVAAAKALGLLA